MTFYCKVKHTQTNEDYSLSQPMQNNNYNTLDDFLL